MIVQNEQEKGQPREEMMLYAFPSYRVYFLKSLTSMGRMFPL